MTCEMLFNTNAMQPMVVWSVAITKEAKSFYGQMQMIMCDLSANWNNSYRELEQRIISMEQKLDELGQSFQSTSELLSQTLQRRHLVHRYHPNPPRQSLISLQRCSQLQWQKSDTQMICLLSYKCIGDQISKTDKWINCGEDDLQTILTCWCKMYSFSAED